MNPSEQRAVDNFAKAVAKLREFLAQPVEDERDKAGVIKAFEYTFELSWRAIQKLSNKHNKTVGSPRQAFQAAFALGWIKAEQNPAGEDCWMVMVDDRNLTMHTYNEKLTDEILERIRADHLPRLEALLAVLNDRS